MEKRPSVQVRTVKWLFLPVTGCVLIPYGLSRLFHFSWEWQGALRQWGGLWLIGNGFGLAAWCVHLFNTEGHGTPFPLDPPTRFVVRGPYRYVRNPMAIGLLTILAGEALWCASWVLVGYLIVLATLVHLFVRYWEEPELTRRFGDAYRAYRQQVPRWMPRRILPDPGKKRP